jgi:hypothetical protein
MRHAATAPEPPAPDLDTDERGEDDEDGDFGELLPDLEEAPPDDDADPDADPFGDAANDLEALLEGEALDGDDTNDLELGPDALEVDEEAPPEGDELGIQEGAHGEDAPEESFPSDDEERDGIDDRRPLVSDLDLPGLDADAEGTDDALERFGTLVLAIELELPLASPAWSLTRLSPERERCSALGAAGDSVVAGSTDLLWQTPDRAAPLRVALDGTRITSLVLVGNERETVLCVTAQGRLVRRARLASDAERVADLGRMPELGAEPHQVELCQLGPDAPRAFIGRAASGLLFRSDDAGTTLRPLEPRRVVRALSPAGEPLVALAGDGKELLVSRDAGRAFASHPLDAPARAVAAGEAPRVASAGDVVALYDRERGLVVSTDSGRSFRDVAGIASATAGVAGSYEGRPVVWVALYSETRDLTRFVLVDASDGSARTIATLTGAADAEGEHATGARIERLVWDGRRLYAAGEAGLLVLAPEPNAPLHPSH